MTKEEILLYELQTLASYEPADLDYPTMEVAYENAAGHEGFIEVCLVDLGRRALANLEKELEKANDVLSVDTIS